jgi:hypothetical protein
VELWGAEGSTWSGEVTRFRRHNEER